MKQKGCYILKVPFLRTAQIALPIIP